MDSKIAATSSTLNSAPAKETSADSKLMSSQQVKILAVALSLIAVIATLVAVEVAYGAIGATVALAVANPVISIVIALILIGAAVYLTIRVCRKPEETKTTGNTEKTIEQSKEENVNKDALNSQKTDKTHVDPVMDTTNTTGALPQTNRHNSGAKNPTGSSSAAAALSSSTTTNPKPPASNPSAPAPAKNTNHAASATNSNGSSKVDPRNFKPDPASFEFNLEPYIFENKKIPNKGGYSSQLIEVKTIKPINDMDLKAIDQCCEDYLDKYRAISVNVRNNNDDLMNFNKYNEELNKLINDLHYLFPIDGVPKGLKARYDVSENNPVFVSIHEKYMGILNQRIEDLKYIVNYEETLKGEEKYSDGRGARKTVLKWRTMDLKEAMKNHVKVLGQELPDYLEEISKK